MIYRALVSPDTRTVVLDQPLLLEGGQRLPRVEVAYRTWGRPRQEAILVCHALTGSADVDDWWAGLLGHGRAFDPERHFVVASNVLGGCYGTTGPTSLIDGHTVHYAADFPRVTIRDMVHVQARLLDRLGVRELVLVVGGSMGGMQALEWAALYPERVRAIAPVAASARHSAWCIGLSEAQREAIRADAAWRGGYYRLDAGPRGGLAAARMMAMSTYRSFGSFEQKFGRGERRDGRFEVEGYMEHQGRKLVERFDANTYVRLTEAMDSHDLGRGRGDHRAALRSLRAPALVVTITSDVLYPAPEQRELLEHLPDAELATVDSPHGHDAFLIEQDVMNDLLLRFLDRVSVGLRQGAARSAPERSRTSLE